jgi:chromosome segregation ATPase
MYFEPLTLFILGEFLVVYIIINVFLFYKSRLLNVLIALLKEMRFEKHRREQLKQKELAALRATNKNLLSKVDSAETAAKTAGKTIPEQLEARIESLTLAHPRAHNLDSSIEFNESNEWLRMRILELEKELLSGNIDENKWQELASEAVSRFTQATLDSEQNKANKKGNAEDERYTGQLENDLSETQRQLQEAKTLIGHLESELEDIKAINTPTENPMEAPKSGLYADELYKLKCDNFDLHEAINKLKLELLSGEDLDADSFNAMLENQIANMEQYIKSADIATSLFEKELQAAQDEISRLSNQLSEPSGKGKSPGNENKQALTELASKNTEQNDALATIRESISQLQGGGDVEDIIQDLEAEILRLEKLFKESEQCIVLMESSLEASQEEVSQLEDKLASQKAKALKNKMSGLNDAQEGQKAGIGNIKNIMNQIRDGGDEKVLTKLHNDELAKLEGYLKESETLIKQLESELDELNNRADNAQNNADSDSDAKSINSNENMQEMEGLLKQFISDMQSLLTNINKLEDENTKLKQQLKSKSSETLEEPGSE